MRIRVRRGAIALSGGLAILAAGCAHSPGVKSSAASAHAPPPCPTSADADAAWRPEHPVDGTVARICFVGSARWHATQLHAAIVSAEGAPFDRAHVREDIAGLYALGDIEDVRVYADTSEAGVVLVYEVRDRPRLAGVRFEGVDASTEAELRAQLRMGEMTIFDPVRTNDFAEAIRTEYRAHGYARATVSVTTEAASPGAVRAILAIDPGPRAVVAKIAFAGASKIPRADLLRAMDTHVGDPYRAAAVDRDVLLLTALYYDHGMILAKVSAPPVTMEESGATALSFAIEEGDVFRIHALRVVGELAKPERDYLAFFRAKPGQIFVRSKLATDLDKMTAFAKREDADADVTVDSDIDPSGRTVDVTLRITKKAAP